MSQLLSQAEWVWGWKGHTHTDTHSYQKDIWNIIYCTFKDQHKVARYPFQPAKNGTGRRQRTSLQNARALFRNSTFLCSLFVLTLESNGHKVAGMRDPNCIDSSTKKGETLKINPRHLSMEHRPRLQWTSSPLQWPIGSVGAHEGVSGPGKESGDHILVSSFPTGKRLSKPNGKLSSARMIFLVWKT